MKGLIFISFLELFLMKC